MISLELGSPHAMSLTPSKRKLDALGARVSPGLFGSEIASWPDARSRRRAERAHGRGTSLRRWSTHCVYKRPTRTAASSMLLSFSVRIRVRAAAPSGGRSRGRLADGAGVAAAIKLSAHWMTSPVAGTCPFVTPRSTIVAKVVSWTVNAMPPITGSRRDSSIDYSRDGPSGATFCGRASRSLSRTRARQHGLSSTREPALVVHTVPTEHGLRIWAAKEIDAVAAARSCENVN
jgi:hypothetical protein